MSSTGPFSPILSGGIRKKRGLGGIWRGLPCCEESILPPVNKACQSLLPLRRGWRGVRQGVRWETTVRRYLFSANILQRCLRINTYYYVQCVYVEIPTQIHTKSGNGNRLAFRSERSILATVPIPRYFTPRYRRRLDIAIIRSNRFT
ncbi:MAG: hypothetical protein HW389_2931 [Bacteroidetes bacterium]|nr:hypothetical protein [Bacteroidota bacterium]